jgi:hypothetical protein
MTFRSARGDTVVSSNVVSCRLVDQCPIVSVAGTGTSKEKGEKKRFRLSSSFTSRENVQVSSLGHFFVYD